MNKKQFKSKYDRIVGTHKLTVDDISGDEYLFNLYIASHWPETHQSYNHAKKYVESNTSNYQSS